MMKFVIARRGLRKENVSVIRYGGNVDADLQALIKITDLLKSSDK